MKRKIAQHDIAIAKMDIEKHFYSLLYALEDYMDIIAELPEEELENEDCDIEDLLNALNVAKDTGLF